MTYLEQLCAALKEVERDLAGMRRAHLHIIAPGEYGIAASYRRHLLRQIKNA